MLRIVIFSVILCCLGLYPVQAQQENPERYLEVRGMSELEMQPLAKATVNLYEGTNKVKSVQTGLDGAFSFKLDINKQYTIEVTKEGLISKRISFNTQMPDEEKGTWMNEFSIGLVKPCSGMDYSVLKEPVDKVKFDNKRREFLSDKEYVNQMRPRIESLMMKNDACRLDNYEALVKKADQIAVQKNYQEAINTYKQALEIYPDEEYPNKRIGELNALINKQQFSAEAYQKLIADADALQAQGKTAEALQKYKQAGTLNPQEAYPRQKIAEIESVLSKEQAARQAQQSLEDRYNQALAKASVAYTRKDFEEARKFYQEASTIKPSESLPKSRIQEIETVLAKKAAENAARAAETAQKAAMEKEYQDLIAQADAQFKAKQFDEAKSTYAKALTLKPAESYPAQRVKTIDNAVAAEKTALQKNQDEAFNIAITSGNNALSKNQFQLARESFQKALTIRPDDLTVKSRLAEVDQQAEAFNKRKSVEEQYNNLIQSGEAFIAKKEWIPAKESFAKAIELRPGDKFASQKITAIENTIAAEQAATAKVQNENYNAAMSAGNNAIAVNQYATARESFTKALTIKPNDPSAKSRLAETDKLEAEFKNRKAADEQYRKIILSADALLNVKDYVKARESYAQALAMKPGDQYAQNKMTTIDNTIAAEQAALMKRQNDGYNASMSAGIVALGKSQYEVAREAFRKALSFKPDDATAKSKLNETDQLEADYKQLKVLDEQYAGIIKIADEQLVAKDYTNARAGFAKALVLKPGDQYAQNKIITIDNTIASEQAARLKAIEDGYKASIGAANTAITQKSYSQAKEFLQKALSFKPGDVYSTGKMAEVDRLMAEEKRKAEQLQLNEQQYKETIAAADRSLKDKDYSGARSTYNKALQLKPGDSYASQKISSIDQIMAAEQAARQKQTEESYTAAMTKGISALDAKDFKSAKESFMQALTLKPGDNNAKQKISETDILAKQEQERLLAEQTRKKKYNDLITSADQNFSQKNYAYARTLYEQALAVIPTETYPRQKIAESAKAIEEQDRMAAEAKARDNAYNQALQNGDQYFRAKDYEQSKTEYTRALTLKPAETFPKTRLAEIENLITQKKKEQDEAKARADGYTRTINAGNAAFAKKDYATAKTSYQEALRFMPGDVLANDQIKKIDYLLAEAEKARKVEEAKKNTFDALIASADKMFDEAKYALSKEEYKRALAIDPSSAHAKLRIARIDEINKLLSQSPSKTSNVQTPVTTAKATAAIPMGELNFKTESERQKYLDELKTKYPAGITLEKYNEQYKETWRYIIIRENQAQEYRLVKFKTYNGSQYSVNGKPITQQYFVSQTKARDGESYKEIEMQ